MAKSDEMANAAKIETHLFRFELAFISVLFLCGCVVFGWFILDLPDATFVPA
jgi:hypothetical protein